MESQVIIYFHHPNGFYYRPYFTLCSEFSTSDNIMFTIAIKNIIHVFINELIIIVFEKYQFLCLQIMAIIKCPHNYLRLNGSLEFSLVTQTLGNDFIFIVVSVLQLSIITFINRSNVLFLL